MSTPHPQTPPLPKPKKSLLRRLLKWTLRAAILLITLAITAYAIVYYWSSKTINAEIARIRAAGEPLTFTQLNSRLPMPEKRDQDAGPFYLAACELVTDDYQADTDLDLYFGKNEMTLPVPPDVIVKAQRKLEENRYVLEFVDLGSTRPECSADIQLQYGMTVAITHVAGKPKALQNMVYLRSRLLASEGKPDQAVDSLISSFGVNRIFDRQPVIIDALVQLAMFAKSSKEAAVIMSYGQPSDAALLKLNNALLQMHLVQPREIFIAERVYFLETCRNLIANSSQSLPGEFDGPMIPEQQMGSGPAIGLRYFLATGLPTYARYINASHGDWPGILSATQAVADTPANIMEKITGNSFAVAMVTYARTLSVQRSTLIAIQIERYRRAHNNQLPDSLSQLPDPANLPKDPFTGTSLLYTKTPDGYCVFSAGRNNPKDNPQNIDPTKDPITWSTRWGTHIRTHTP